MPGCGELGLDAAASMSQMSPRSGDERNARASVFEGTGGAVASCSSAEEAEFAPGFDPPRIHKSSRAAAIEAGFDIPFGHAVAVDTIFDED